MILQNVWSSNFLLIVCCLGLCHIFLDPWIAPCFCTNWPPDGGDNPYGLFKPSKKNLLKTVLTHRFALLELEQWCTSPFFGSFFWYKFPISDLLHDINMFIIIIKIHHHHEFHELLYKEYKWLCKDKPWISGSPGIHGFHMWLNPPKVSLSWATELHSDRRELVENVERLEMEPEKKTWKPTVPALLGFLRGLFQNSLRA